MNKEEVKYVVHETLTGLGFTVDDPHQMQQDMIYIRQFREGSQAFKRNVSKVFISVSLPGLLYLMWDSIKNTFHQEIIMAKKTTENPYQKKTKKTKGKKSKKNGAKKKKK